MARRLQQIRHARGFRMVIIPFGVARSRRRASMHITPDSVMREKLLSISMRRFALRDRLLARFTNDDARIRGREPNNAREQD